MSAKPNDFIITTTPDFSDLEGDLGGSAFSKPSSNQQQASSNQASTSLNLGYDSGAKNSPYPIDSTLDEPVIVTITRDLKAVGYKFGHVFFPKKSNLLLKGIWS